MYEMHDVLMYVIIWDDASEQILLSLNPAIRNTPEHIDVCVIEFDFVVSDPSSAALTRDQSGLPQTHRIQTWERWCQSFIHMTNSNDKHCDYNQLKHNHKTVAAWACRSQGLNEHVMAHKILWIKLFEPVQWVEWFIDNEKRKALSDLHYWLFTWIE